MKNVIICKNCGNINAKGKFCTVCGTALEIPPAQTLICPECGREYHQGKFCVVCGTQLIIKQQSDENAVLICSRCSKPFSFGTYCTSCGGTLVSRDSVQNDEKNDQEAESGNQNYTQSSDENQNTVEQSTTPCATEDYYVDPQNCKTQKGAPYEDVNVYSQKAVQTDVDTSDIALAEFLKQYRAEKYGVAPENETESIERYIDDVPFTQPLPELPKPTFDKMLNEIGPVKVLSEEEQSEPEEEQNLSGMETEKVYRDEEQKSVPEFSQTAFEHMISEMQTKKVYNDMPVTEPLSK